MLYFREKMTVAKKNKNKVSVSAPETNATTKEIPTAFVVSLRRSDRSTSRATATLLVRHPTLNERFEVLAKVRHMEGLLAYNGRCLVLSRSTAIPAQTIFDDKQHQLAHHGLIFGFRGFAPKVGRRTSRYKHIPIDVSGRTRSITIPTVSAKRTGL